MVKFFLILLFFITIPFEVFSQNNGRTFITNFERNDYNASIANWSSYQDLIGNIYFANFDGVLKYNGNNWTLTNLKNNAVALSIAIDSENKIYVGSLKDFGYLEPNLNGKLTFKSLKKYLPKNVSIQKIENIKILDNHIFFISKEYIFKWDYKKIDFWNFKNSKFTSDLFMYKKEIHVVTDKNGIVILRNNGIVSVPNTNLNSNSLIIDSQGNKRKIIINSGFTKPVYFNNYQFINNNESNLHHYVKKNILHSSSINTFQNNIKNLTFAFSTLNGKGIILTDNELVVKKKLTTRDGLKSDKIRGVYFDKSSNLWASMQHGISKVEINSPWEFWHEDDGLKGTIWDVNKINDKIYIATTEGLFYLENDIFIKIKGINSKVWTLDFFEDSNNERYIIAGTNDGLYQVSKANSSKLLDFTVITKIKYFKEKNLIIIGHKDGVSSLNLNNLKVQDILKIKNNTYYDIKNFDNYLWISSKFVGVYKIYNWESINSNHILLNTTNGLKDVNQINIIKNDDDILFTTYNGIYKYDSKTDSLFLENNIFKSKKKIMMAIKDEFNNYFFSISNNRKEHIESLYLKGINKIKKTRIPFVRLPEAEITSIYPDEDSIIWVSSTKGLFKYDAKTHKDYTLPFNTVISQTSTTDDSVLFYGNYYDPADTSIVPSIIYEQPDSFKPVLEYKDNNITFEYSATFYEVPEKNEFSYFLENNDEHWSHWTTENKKEYNNLPAGEYTFKVKSRNIYETIGRTASYSFTILPPWYQTGLAYFGFTLAGLFLFWFILLAYSYRVRMHRRNLKLIVADRTFEVMSQKKELENKQEEILSMNQQLSELNTSLEQKVRERTSRIVSTLKKLQKTNKELDTFVYKASHDLKNPLTQIIGLVTLAKREKLDKNAKEYLKRIEDTSFNMEELLHKLTEVHETFNKSVIKEDIDFYDTLNELVTEFKNSEACQNTNLTFDTEKNTHITTDSFLLDIILKKLLENALFYRKDETEPHEISIATSEKEDFFNIIIKDNGIGIEEEHRDKVYDMFFRGTEKSKGNGLGLYLVNQSVEKLHGKISFTSIKDEYTEFTVSIPSR